MARECIKNCPRITATLEVVQSDNAWAGPLAFHPDMMSNGPSGAELILQACADAYDCTGPVEVVTEVEVFRGFLRRRRSTELRTEQNCGLPE